MRNRILHLLLLVLCLFMGSGSAFAADESGSKCGTPAASHIYRYFMVYDTRGADYARRNYGSLEKHAQVGIDKCNQVVKNSNIDAYFELGDVMELTDYTLTDGTSAAMMAAGASVPERPDVRKRWRDGNCHICALVVSPGGNSLSGNFTLEPLSWDVSCGVMDAGSLVETYTLIHETGHVFGCHHDNVYTIDSHPYALGYVDDKYYTIMSYGHMAGGKIAPVAFFSGPDQVYNGVTLGDATHNNARMFREHLDIVDQYTQRSKIVIVKESEETYYGAVVRYIEDNTLVLSNSKTYATLTVTASDVLSISTGEKWMNLTVNRAEGSMDYNVIINITDFNYGNTPREGKIVIQSLSDPSFVKELTVIQNCPNGVVVSPSEYTVTSEAQTLSAKFKADGSGTLRSESSWITVGGKSSASFSADCTMTFEVAANTTGQDRVGTLKAYRSESQSFTTIKVTQKAAGVGFDNFSMTSIDLDSRKQTQQISFFAGQTFSVTAPDWVTCTKTGETGNVTVNVSVEANTTGATRSGDIRFTTADGKFTRVVSVSQSAATSYEVDLKNWNPNCRAQNKLVHLTTATNWQVEIEDPYGKALTVSPMSGTGNATLDINVTENGGGKSRYFKVTIKGDDSCEPVTIQIEQSPYNDKAVAPDPEVEEGGKDPVVDPDPNPGTGGGNGGDNGGNTGGGDDKDPEVTPADGQTYTIRLDNGGTTPLYLTTTTVKDNNDVTYSLSTQPEEFIIVSTDKGYTLQSASSKKYVGYTTGNGWDCYDVADTWAIASIEGVSTTILKDDKVGLGVDKAEDKAGVFTNKPDKDHPNAIYHWIISPVKDEPTVPVEPEKKVCATPVISLEGGQLAITCETPDATISYTLTMPALNLAGTDVSKLSSDLAAQELTLVVKAAAKDYEDSEEASRTFKLNELFSLSKPGDVNADGVQSIEDVVRLIDLLLKKK